MELAEKLRILADCAKYDVACTSSGAHRDGAPGGLGSCDPSGICHTFSADGRCISLLKILMSNCCAYDCRYCVNRCSNDIPRASFSPRELADLTIQFYRRNYIEGLFLSSGILKNPDHTCEQMIEALSILRKEYQFRGYIHAKAIPGADSRLIAALGALADRLSVNIELPSQRSLSLLCPDKTKTDILKPMDQIHTGILQNSADLVRYRHTPQFAPAGQSTQMIIGATPEDDRHILTLSQGLYRRFGLKRVFFSAYIPVQKDSLLPALDTKPPLLREHRLYQADWLLRFYGFEAGELLSEENPNFDPLLDPKCCWALRNMELFPIEVNSAPYEMLLRVPGIGVQSARRIVAARRSASLGFEELKRMGVVLKRAQYFLLCRGKAVPGLRITPMGAYRAMVSQKDLAQLGNTGEQLSLYPSPAPSLGHPRPALPDTEGGWPL